MDVEQRFTVEYLHETCDRGSYNRFRKFHCMDESELSAGAVMDVHGHKLEIISFDEDEMVFTYRGSRYVLNREWQVIGTVQYHVENIYVQENERYVFYFEAAYNVNEWDEDRLVETIVDMMQNAQDGMIWKNIPLARECMHIMKDLSPFRDNGCINPVQRMYICQKVMEENLIELRETPRLYQSFCEYWRSNCYLADSEDYDTIDPESDFDKNYFRVVDEYIYKLGWLLEEEAGKHGMSIWDELGTLKADPVQLTLEWEKNIYEVELECDEALKDEPRGMGFCHSYWSTKRAVLARRGIQWRSPSSMNPRVMFD